MRTLHKIYLFVILISILLYNLYSISKKNKEGFFFGYSPIFNWNRPLELPKKEAEEQKKRRYESNNSESEMSYEEYMRKKEEEEDNEEECKELMKEFKGVCEDRDNSNNLLEKCPDECEIRKSEWDYIDKTNTMKNAAIKDEEDKAKKKRIKKAKEDLKDALQKRLLPTNLPDIKQISDDFNDVNDFSKFFNYTDNVSPTPEGCKKALMFEKSRYMVTQPGGECFVLDPSFNNQAKYKLFTKSSISRAYKIWEYVNDYTYDNTGTGDLKRGQYVGHMNTTLEECKKLGIGNKSKYIAWTGNRAYEPGGYCKVLIKKYNKNPDLTTNLTPDASFNLYKFTGKYEKRPNDKIYNSLLKPMTGKPSNEIKWLIARKKYDKDIMEHSEYTDISNNNLNENQKLISVYKKIFDNAYKIKPPTLTIVDIQKKDEDSNGKYKEYRIEIITESKHKMNRLKALIDPDKYDYFGNIKESFQVNRNKEGFITREGHKNCGKNHKEKFMNISRSQEVIDIMHTLTKLDKIDMDK